MNDELLRAWAGGRAGAERRICPSADKNEREKGKRGKLK